MEALVIALVVVALLAILSVLAEALGADSRDGIGDTHRSRTVSGSL